MTRTLAVNCVPILVWSKNDGKTAAETASDEMVMGAVRALGDFSLLVSQQNHLDQSLNSLDDALKQFYQKKGIFREQEMSKSANAKLDDMLATESHLLHQEMIHKICAAKEALMYGADKVSTSKRRQFQVRLNRAQQAATTCSDADDQKAIERLEREIHQVTPAKRKLFDKCFQYYERQLLREAWTKATGPRGKFAKELTTRKGAAEDKGYEAANVTVGN